MDDRQTYLLNGLLARHFSLGRIVRFRPVDRGRQGEAYELFTAQEKEYLAIVLPAGHAVGGLNRIAEAVNLLDAQRFSVVPFVPAKSGGFVGEGPQNAGLMVSLAPEGSALPADQYTEHDVSQVGLRLAWMHRLFEECLPTVDQAAVNAAFAAEVQRLESRAPGSAGGDPLLKFLDIPVPMGWAHGDIQAGALLHDADHQLRTVTDWALLHEGCPLEDLVDAFVFLALDERGQLIRDRARALLEGYATLRAIGGTQWPAVVARWCGQRAIHADRGQRPNPARWAEFKARPLDLAVQIAQAAAR